jgi:hypothetical protein
VRGPEWNSLVSVGWAPVGPAGAADERALAQPASSAISPIRVRTSGAGLAPKSR